MATLEAVGVRGSGVRLQRFEDGATLRAVPGLFTLGYIFDPWGTRIELVEDPEHLGFHHIHLSAADPEKTLAWYGDVFGGKPARLKGRLDGLMFDDIWVLASRHEEGTPATTDGRAIDHIAFVVDDLEKAAAELRRKRVTFLEAPTVPTGARTGAKRAVLAGPDNVKVAVVEPGFAGVEVDRVPAPVATGAREPFLAPRTPWGEPDFQGVWTGNSGARHPARTPQQPRRRRVADG